MAVDYDQLAKQYGGSAAPSVDYDALAKKFGGASTPTKPETNYDDIAKQFGGVSAPLKPEPAAPTAPAEKSGFLRQAADIPIGVTQGLLGGIRMIANAFGADSDTSKLIKGYEDKIGELLSAQAKNDKKEISRILKEAEDKGVLDQLVAAGKAFATAPIDLTVQALGTSAPGIVAGLGTTLAGAPTAVAIGASSAVGAVMGAGEVKGNIYDATKEELLNINVPEAKAEKIAAEAQAYGGKNLDQILIASGIGAVTGGTGFESAAIKGLTGRILGKAVAKEGAEAVGKGVTRRVSEGILKESVPEFIQGSQQQLAENIALQREGFDVPTGRGVVSQGALEALSSLPLGAYAGYKDRGKAAQTEEDKLLADLDAQAEREEAAGEGGIDEFIAQQRAGVEAESRADVAGVSGISPAEAAGVSDTGVPTAPTEGGLAGVGADTTATGERTRAEPSALEQQIQDLTRQRDRLEAAIEDTQYEGDYAGMQELQQQVAQYDAQIADLTQQLQTAPKTDKWATGDRYLEEMGGWEGVRAATDEANTIEGTTYTLTESYPTIGEESVTDIKVTRLPDDKTVVTNQSTDRTSVFAASLASTLTDEDLIKRTLSPTTDFENISITQADREAAAPKAEEVLDEKEVKGTQEQRNVATYLEGLPQDIKRYNTYINNEEVGPLLQSANDAIQRLTDFINGRGFSVREVNRATADKEVQRAKDLSSEVSGIASRLLVKQDGVDRNLKRANPEQLAKSRAELEAFINNEVNAFLSSASTGAARPSKPAFAPDTYTRRPGETEKQYAERIIAQPTSKLAPDILELLQNNDLNGALRAVAARFLAGPKIRTFYGDLATRIADLNLPTEVRIGDQRNLTRRSIDAFTRPEQIRLFAYLRTKQPWFFDQYFKDYDKAEALETVYAGLLELQKFESVLGPVRAEYDTVKKTFTDNMFGISANGAYYPTFDVLNLNDSVGRSNGLDYYTLMHEAVHAATEMLLVTPENQRTAEQNDAITQLKELYRLARNNTNFDYYGLTNLSEFITEAFTNKKFQDFLKSIPYAPARTNIFKRFIQTVLNLVGIDNVAARTMVEAEKLFSAARPFQVLSAGPRFAGAKKPRIRGPVSKPDTWRTQEQVATSLTDLFNDALKGRRSWDEVLKTVGPAMWDSSTGAFRSALLGMANLRQIGDLTATKFPQLQGAIRIIEKMLAYRGKKLNQASEIVKAWTTAQAKNPKQSELVSRVMLEATIRGQTPSALPTTDALRRAWDGLSPEFKKIYEDVRKFYADSVNEMVREMKKRALGKPKEERQEILRKINEQFGPDKLKQPYFPLRRFGTYWFQVGKDMNKEFYEFESRLSRNLAMRNRRNQLLAGNEQQRKLAGTIEKGNGISELYNQNVGTTKVLEDVQKLVDKVGASDVAELKSELRDSLNQLIYLLLPQQSMRKMFINRKAIQGASSDMLRVFATTAVHSAYQQSRFKYAQPFLNNLNNARDYIRQLPTDADTKAVYDDYIKEVEARAKTILSNEDTSMSAKVAGKASEATFYFMLSAPFTSILNVLGFAQITMPYIGGRYGYAKTNAVILKNFGRYFKSMPTRTINPLREGRYMETSFPSIAEGGDLSPLMQRAADRFIEEGQINISLTNDIFDIGDRPSDLYTGKYNAVKKAISGLFHQSERLNREVTLLTVFELAYDKFRTEPKKDLRGVVARDAAGNPVKNTDDEAFELAIAEAKDIAGLSLGDFTRQMKPRYFTSPLMSVLTKFKQYPVMATYAVARNFYFTFAAPFRTKEIADFRKQLEKDNLDPKVIDQRIAEAEAQRKQIYQEGRRRLAGILGVTFLLGGIEAQPFFSTLVGPIVKMLGNDDDDDEFFNWENWFRNYMEEELGGYAGSMFEQLGIDKEKAAKLGRKTGEAVGRGVIPAITGGSLADRVSLDPKNLWYREGRYSPDVRESIIENVIANAGPVVGLGFNWIDAYKLMQEGQYQRAFEKAAPAIVSKPVSAARLSEEGAKTRSGVTLVDNFTATEIAMQAIGLQPERLAQAQKAAIEAKEKEQKIEDRRNTIMNRLWLERDNPEGFEVTLEEANKFTERYPLRKIDYESIVESFEKRTKEAAEAEAFGAKITKKLRPEVEPMLRYGRE